MKCNYKIRHTKVDDDILKYCQKRIEKFENLLPQATFVEVEFIDEFGARGGIDKHVQVDLSIPGEKNTIHVEDWAEDWQSAIDLVQERLEKEIKRLRERQRDMTRYPKKYKAAEEEQRTMGEIV